MEYYFSGKTCRSPHSTSDYITIDGAYISLIKLAKTDVLFILHSILNPSLRSLDHVKIKYHLYKIKNFKKKKR